MSCYIIIASLIISLFPLNSVGNAQSPAEIIDNMENDFILCGYVITCLYNSTDNKNTANNMIKRYKNDFIDKYFESQYRPFEDKLSGKSGLSSNMVEQKIYKGITYAKTSSLMNCKHNINEMIKLFNKIGVSAPYLLQALQSY